MARKSVLEKKNLCLLIPVDNLHSITLLNHAFTSILLSENVTLVNDHEGRLFLFSITFIIIIISIS